MAPEKTFSFNFPSMTHFLELRKEIRATEKQQLKISINRKEWDKVFSHVINRSKLCREKLNEAFDVAEEMTDEEVQNMLKWGRRYLLRLMKKKVSY